MNRGLRARGHDGTGWTGARPRPGRLPAPLVGLLLLGALVVSGCADLLRVEQRDEIAPDDLDDPSGAQALYAGAVGTFGEAYAGAWFLQGQVAISGLLADEWVHTGNRAGQEQIDRRRPSAADFFVERPLGNLYRARASLEEAAAVLRSQGPGSENDRRLAEVLGLAGFSYVLFAENVCSGVPFSTADRQGRVTHGEPLTRGEILELALDRFEEALEVAERAEAPELAHLARVGGARALLDLDRVEEAAAVAGPVPTDFTRSVQRSTNSRGQYNGIRHLNAEARWWSVADREGSVGLPFRAADDPRVPWARSPGDGIGADGKTPHYVLLKYESLDAPVPLADGIEARLIEAEAALRASRIEEFLQVHDRLRARVGLPTAEDPGSVPARVDFHFRERAFWLFATSHRLGDLRRLVRQYGRNPESVFPTGDYFDGGSYGPDVNLPVPAGERNNPHFTGCLNREA